MRRPPLKCEHRTFNIEHRRLNAEKKRATHASPYGDHMLSSQQLAFYENNGYVVVEDLIPAATLKTLRERITEIVEAASEAGNRPLPGIQMMTEGATAKRAPLRKLALLAFNDEFFRSVAASPSILDVAAKLTGDAKQI